MSTAFVDAKVNQKKSRKENCYAMKTRHAENSKIISKQGTIKIMGMKVYVCVLVENNGADEINGRKTDSLRCDFEKTPSSYSAESNDAQARQNCIGENAEMMKLRKCCAVQQMCTLTIH